MGIGNDKEGEAGETFGKAFGRGQGDYPRLCAIGELLQGQETTLECFMNVKKAASILL